MSSKKRALALPIFDDKVAHVHRNVLYFDNNSTTLMCPAANEAMQRWHRCLNPSSDSSVAASAKLLLDRSIQYIQRLCNAQKYTVLFTSGATESNCTIIRITVDAYWIKLARMPHIIISEIEHHSILECAATLAAAGRVRVTRIAPDHDGIISPAAVERTICRDTCLVSIIYANNEIGSINNITAIGRICKAKRIPFHTDAVQIFGKRRIDVIAEHISALSASFHKIYGPKGIGLLLIDNRVIEGYALTALITGSQQGGLRGGTENVTAIVASIKALAWAHTNRARKNRILEQLCVQTMRGLGKILPISNAHRYLGKSPDFVGREPIELLLLGPPLGSARRLPNTLLICVAKNIGAAFCNVKFKQMLDKAGVIVSIASACLTSSPRASHVLTAIDAPTVVKRGVLRISFSDTNTPAQIAQFIDIFAKVLREAR